MKKVRDPLWAIVGEDVRLQGREKVTTGTCPRCNVKLEIPEDATVGDRARCGICGAVSTLRDEGLVADDGTPEVGEGLSE